MSGRRWRLAVDTGGTFTDCVARSPDGATHRAKVLSSGLLRAALAEVDGARLRLAPAPAPSADLSGFSVALASDGAAAGERARVCEHHGDWIVLDRALAAASVGAAVTLGCDEEAPLVAARLVTGCAAGAALPPMELRLATTRGTNALLERGGEPVALFITGGFADLLLIGDQQRPDIFARRIERAPPLYREVVEVDERLAADGAVVRPFDARARAELADAARALVARGITSAAVALAHAYRDDAHEQAVDAALREAGFDHVSLSSRVAPLIKLVDRAETTLVNAYLARVVGGFLAAVARGIDGDADSGGGALYVMTSAGGLSRGASYQPKDSLLSGPAGGVVGAANAGSRSGCEQMLTFDMGGTSTDVARWAGKPELRYQQRVGDARLRSPMLAIETVAAGGGSICAYQHGELSVGPASAGADPGPACYGAGGPLTVTDVNLLLGRLSPQRFGVPVRIEAARAALGALQRDISERSGEQADEGALCEGLLALADERMADAIRRVSLRRGYDPADHTLVAFGGAGPQHACGVAERLGIGRVIVPADAGLLSAVGLSCAALERVVQKQLLVALDEATHVTAALVEAERQARAELAADLGAASTADAISTRSLLALRYRGQDSSIDVEVDARRALDVAALRARFEARHQALFGHRPQGRDVEVDSLRVIARSGGAAATGASEANAASAARDHGVGEAPRASQRARVGGRWRDIEVVARAELDAGAHVDGPALVLEDHCTTFVGVRWRCQVDRAGALVLERDDDAQSEPIEQVEAVRTELFAGRLAGIAEEMGELLQRTALSTNVKERLDFSCTLLDADGELVVNAPHMPVHLGAMGLCVREVVAALPLGPGDVVVTNHPGFGGSHLPDITVITAVHDADDELLGYVASRAHHAEIGGKRPGSMPPDAKRLLDEGVIIAPRYLVRAGEARWDALRDLLQSGPWPSRAVADNVADLRAAVAANHLGAQQLAAIAAERSAREVACAMADLKARAEREVRRAFSELDDGTYQASTRLDDGAELRVAIEIAGDRARVDFSGSADVHPGNLNATPAIVRGAVIYVLRLLVDRPLPLNEGLMAAVELRVPRGMLSPDFSRDDHELPAVVGGNVETSQRLCDILLEALGLMAHSQGTMNNLLFGDATFGYYETICGGHGAAADAPGASAVHTHMTNTRITDVEVLEQRYAVRLERFGIRRGSGGDGAQRGGDGAIRELTFLAPLSLSLLTQRRVAGPRGLAGGDDGQAGRQTLRRADGSVEQLASVDAADVEPGDNLVVETPGGGGWGAR